MVAGAAESWLWSPGLHPAVAGVGVPGRSSVADALGSICSCLSDLINLL